LGFEISYLNSDANGLIDIEELKSLMREDTILVSINAINSEIGIRQPIEEIGEVLKQYSKCFYHVDLTQAIGKIRINFDNIDLASFSAHKIYGLKGVGCLVKKNSIVLEPLIHGGKSTSVYRSGTLSKYEGVYINSNDYCIPHILNISILNVKAETFMRALSKYEVYISTKSACSDEESYSESVYALTKNKELARSSIRISLSYLTTKEELKEFLKIFSKVYKELKSL